MRRPSIASTSDGLGHATDAQRPRRTARGDRPAAARRGRDAARRGGELHRGQRRAARRRGADLAVDVLRLLRGQGGPARGADGRRHDEGHRRRARLVGAATRRRPHRRRGGDARDRRGVPRPRDAHGGRRRGVVVRRGRARALRRAHDGLAPRARRAHRRRPEAGLRAPGRRRGARRRVADVDGRAGPVPAGALRRRRGGRRAADRRAGGDRLEHAVRRRAAAALATAGDEASRSDGDALRPMTDFGTILRASARSYAGNVAVWDDGREQTYAELFDRACRLANALRALGLRKGDRVALLGPNAFETVEQTAGLALGGFVRAGLYAHQTGEVNAYLLGLVGARALLVDARHVDELRPHLGALEHVIVYGDDAGEYEALLDGADPGDPGVELEDDDVHVIRFSAGTTGRPKGIYHTVSRWLAIGDEYRWVTPQIDERDRYLAAGQLTHAAVIFLWPMLQVGGRVVVMQGFDPALALRLIEEQRITFTLMVPTMIQVLVHHPDAGTRALSSLRCLNYAASPISETTMARALEVFGPVLYQMYGQSEAVPATMLLPHQHRSPWTRSVGRPTPNTKVTVVDEDGTPLPRGEIGEIAVQTPGSMSGLWNDPEGTAARLLTDGSVLTRDMGYVDDDGFVHLADRKEDMIISGGYNIWPAELEHAIGSHTAVRVVGVVGVPLEKWGDSPVAVVGAREGSIVEPGELIALTRERCGSVKKITAVEIVAELPKSGVGKVLRREVRERYWTGRAERVAGA